MWRVDFGHGSFGGPRVQDTTFDDDISGGGGIGIGRPLDMLGFTRLDNARAPTPKGRSGSAVWVFPPGIQPPGIQLEALAFTVAVFSGVGERGYLDDAYLRTAVPGMSAMAVRYGNRLEGGLGDPDGSIWIAGGRPGRSIHVGLPPHNVMIHAPGKDPDPEYKNGRNNTAGPVSV